MRASVSRHQIGALTRPDSVRFDGDERHRTIAAAHLFAGRLVLAQLDVRIMVDQRSGCAVVQIGEGAWQYCYRAQHKLVARALRAAVRDTRNQTCKPQGGN